MRAGALWRRAVRQSHDPTLRTDAGTYGWLEGQGTSARAPLAPLRVIAEGEPDHLRMRELLMCSFVTVATAPSV